MAPSDRPVLVIGSLNMDLVAHCARLPAPGETVPGRDFATHPGGKGANQAVAAARMGARVAMAGAVGADAFGAALRAGLIAEGIDAAGVATIPGPTGTALIVVADDGANSIVVVPGANASVDPAAVDRALAAWPTPGLLLLQHEIPEAAVARAIEAGHARGWFVVLNPAPARPVPARLMGAIDLIAPNETEAGALLGGTIGDPAAAAAALVARGARAALITLGAAGAVWADAAGTRVVAPVKVAAVDTTAAGDAFLGALGAMLPAMLPAGGRIDEVLHVAAAAAALSVTRPGAQPSLPFRAEVEAFISRAADRFIAC